MTAREKIIKLALEQVGKKEDGIHPNRIYVNDWFYLSEKEIAAGKHADGDGRPWCGTGVSWVYAHAGYPLGAIDYMKGFAGCIYAVNNVHKWGRLIDKKDVLPSDILFFKWPGSKSLCDHTGLFKSLLANDIPETIEGNTGLGSDSNGGEWMVRQRRWSDVKYIVRANVLNNA